jgi:hypothetical protein
MFERVRRAKGTVSGGFSFGDLSRRSLQGFALSLALIAANGCAKNSSTFSVLGTEENFNQTALEIKGEIDILWVVDNSGSMLSSQQNVADNFGRFIERFQDKGYDYRIAVASTEAYRSLIGGSAEFAEFRDGVGANRSGVRVIQPSTPNLAQTFLTNILIGIAGSGDERAFQSIEAALKSPANAGFLRPGAFLSVVIVSDEDDFSHDGPESRGGQYSYAGLHPVSRTIGILDQLTQSTAERRNYNVSSIAILDQTCLNTLNATTSGRKIGQRYMQLSQATDGVVGSLCGDFGTTMSDISNRIIELTTEFKLNRKPNPATLRVFVDGVEVAASSQNGYVYDAERLSVRFFGGAVPAAGSRISVQFDPLELF